MNWEDVAEGIQSQLDAIIGELQFSRKFLERLDQGVESLEQGQVESNIRLGKLEAGQSETNLGLGKLEAGQSETNVRLGKLEEGQSETNVRLHRLEEGQQGIGTYLKSIDVGLESNNSRQFWLEKRVDAIEKRLNSDPQ